MTRKTTTFLLPLPLLLMACGASFQAYKPAVTGALKGTVQVAGFVKSTGLADRDPVKCYVGAGLATAARSAHDAVASWQPGEGTITKIPGVSLKVDDCHALLQANPDPALATDAAEEVKRVTDALLPVLGDGGRGPRAGRPRLRTAGGR